MQVVRCHKHVIVFFFSYFQSWMLCKAFSSPAALWNGATRRYRNQRFLYRAISLNAATSRSHTNTVISKRTLFSDDSHKYDAPSCRSRNCIGLISSSRGGSRFSHSYSSGNLVEDSSSASDTSMTAEASEPATLSSIKIPSVVIADDKAFAKPAPDKRQYRSIRLGTNNLQVLLISDPNTDTEAAAVHLRTGHFNDPSNRAGLAHFHEHCLFLGTSKYPTENEYEEFLNKHGGYSNAYTDMEDTNYYFCVAPLDHDDDDEDELQDAKTATTVSSALSGGLDRFAQFFVSPLFKDDAIERELRAVDSEYSNSLNSDQWRMHQLLKSSCDPRHPFSKFGCGNYNTLTDGGNIHETANLKKEYIEKLAAIPFHGGTSPRKDLLLFWKRHYHASNMKLVVLGRGILDDLQAVVEETFGSVRADGGLDINDTSDYTDTPLLERISCSNNSEVCFSSENARYGVAAFHPTKNLGGICEVIPVKEKRTIQLLFATPPMQDPLIRKSLPQRLVSHLLGHEAPGSLHHLLSDLGYINSLSSGISVDTRDFSLFSLTMGMTPNGMSNTEEVLDLCFQWIAMIRSLVFRERSSDGNDLVHKYHDELKRLSQNSFMFRENGDPTSFVSSAAESLYVYEDKPGEMLRGDSFYSIYDEDITKAFLQRLRPENVMITIIDSDLKKKCPHLKDLGEAPWKKETWYGAIYRNFIITDLMKKKWSNPSFFDARLNLPRLNQFIATDFSLRCDDEIWAQENKGKTESAHLSPPTKILETPIFRLWHKMDAFFRVPKVTFNAQILTPNVYRSPRTITAGRLFQKVLNDDLNSFVYDATVAGNAYRVSVVPAGFIVSVVGYSQKMPALLQAVTSRIMSLLSEMKEGKDRYPILDQKYTKALQNLLRETKNFRLDSPLAIASYNSRMLLEHPVWHIEQYITEMEGEVAEKDPLTMKECALLVEEALTGRVVVDILCMGNVNEAEAKELTEVFRNQILSDCLPLCADEIPRFRTNQLPTKLEASSIFRGLEPNISSYSIVLEDIAVSQDENNNAVEITFQAACDYKLGYEGVAILELICHLAYPSAFNKLRTQEQLGYMVSAHARKTVGDSRGFCIEVQSNTALPEFLEERCEVWLETFRQELEDMSVERLEMEAAAVVSQLKERDTKLSQEISRAWDEITGSADLGVHGVQPPFDRLDRLADVLTTFSEDDDIPVSTLGPKTGMELKRAVLDFFDLYISKSSKERRTAVSRIYGYKSNDHFDASKGRTGIISSYNETQRVKQYLSLLPNIPYWV